jgi:hypothetical protein
MVVVGGLAGCDLTEKYARINRAADQWLLSNRGMANINVEGAWEAWESGWGEIRFEQVGPRWMARWATIPSGASCRVRRGVSFPAFGKPQLKGGLERCEFQIRQVATSLTLDAKSLTRAPG